MDINRISESDWISLLDGKRTIQFEFLALQLFLVNLRYRRQKEGLSIQDCIRELRGFYSNFSRLPITQKDFAKIATPESSLASQLLDPEEVARRIAAGQSLILAAEEELLARQPPGNWIGGTIPYFMTQDGGRICKNKIFVTEIPSGYQTSTRLYNTAELPTLYQATEPGMVSFVILPANSDSHVAFALQAPLYEGFALHPLVGWIAGIDLANLGKQTPKVFCGGPEPLANAAAVMRIKLPPDCLAEIKTINLFKPSQGDTLRFPTTGFSATTVFVNGQECRLAEYLHRINADTRRPLVANYAGAMVNVSLKHIDPVTGRVDFYAPVVANTEYRLAVPIEDYVSEFEARVKVSSPGQVLFSCNCILNYLHSKLEGRRLGAFVGPATFGEIAYQLLNQTLVYLEIVKVASSEPAAAETDLSMAMTQLAAAHDELLASEQRFRALSEGLPIGVFLTDSHGHLIYENAYCQKLSSGDRLDHQAGDWIRTVHPDDRPGILAALETCEREGRDINFEFRFAYPDGTNRWVHTWTTFLRSDSGEITGRIGVVQDISDQKRAEVDLERVSRELMLASREAGIAEMATGVLHNVKNVINSINVSAGIIADQVQRSKSSSLTKVAALLREHAGDLPKFISEHPKGKLLPTFLDQLADVLEKERASLLTELRHFEQNVGHIKEIVMMQQSCAKLGGGSEKFKPVDLMEDALRFNTAALVRHKIDVVREYDANLPEIVVEKHKVLQILVNFIRNGKDACGAMDRLDKKIILRLTNDGEFVQLAVQDNGIGISPENMARLFEHGFTTKKTGHGFGLHSSELTTRQLEGKIQVQSDGVGCGATFTLFLPLRPPVSNSQGIPPES